MLQQNDKPPPYTRLEWIALIFAATFAIGTLANLLGCHADELRECQEQRNVKCPTETDVVLAEYESQLIAADLAGYERRMYEEKAAVTDTGLQTRPDAVNGIQRDTRTVAVAPGSPDDESKSQKQTAHFSWWKEDFPPDGSPARIPRSQKSTAHPAGPKVWPQVLSVFTSRDKYDKLAGASSPIKLPPLDANRIPRPDAPRSEWLRRRVVPDDWLLAHRTLPLGSMARLCQRSKCVDVPVLGRGTYGARCSSPELCEGDRCDRRTSDPARPGDDSAWWWTIQRKLDGPCVYRGIADVTPLVCESLGCVPMTPATVTAL